MKRLIILILLISWSTFFQLFMRDYSQVFPEAAATISFGLILLMGYLASDLFVLVKLPRITAYLAVGLVMGPYVLHTIDFASLKQLSFIDQLALNFIGLAAGAELHLSELKKKIKPITSLIFVGGSVTFLGMLTTLRILNLSFLQQPTPRATLLVLVLCSILALARSPSSVIAIISETNAKGPFTETVMGVTVTLDVFIILLFAIVSSIGASILNPEISVDIIFLGSMVLGILVSFIIGAGVGFFISFYFQRIASETIFFVLALVFLIARFSGVVHELVHDLYHIDFHLEPMIICLVAGFVARNFTQSATPLLEAIEKGSLPVYVLFFALTGAKLDVSILKNFWHVAVIFSLVRFISMNLGAFAGATLAREPIRLSRLYGLTFITQAGVSFGLVKMMNAQFSSLGETLGTVLIAAIILNEVIGPILLKSALVMSGETGKKQAG